MNYQTTKTRKTKKAIPFISAAILAAITAIIIFFAGCATSGLTKEEISEYIGTTLFPTETFQGTYSINTDDLREVVGDSDYVIVAKVTGYTDTTYSASGTPLTEYSIQVKENIKGKLDASQEIPLLKEGGLNEANTAFVIYEDDILPQIGKTYIFCLYGQSSGAIRACGKNYTLAIENETDYKNEENYINILAAYEDEIISSRTRYQSQYEVS